MRSFSKVSIELSHKCDGFDYNYPVEITIGNRAIKALNLPAALHMLPSESEIHIIARGSVGEATVHAIARNISEYPLFVFLDLSEVVEFERVRNSPFEGNKRLRSIKFPKNLLSINPRAFADCTNLFFVSIPETVVQIGEKAFLGCENLTELEFKNPNEWFCLRKGKDAESVLNLDNSKTTPQFFTKKTGKYWNQILFKKGASMEW